MGNHLSKNQKEIKKNAGFYVKLNTNGYNHSVVENYKPVLDEMRSKKFKPNNKMSCSTLKNNNDNICK